MTEASSARRIDTLPKRGDVAFHEIAYIAGCAGCARATGAIVSGGREIRDSIRTDLTDISELTGIPVTIVNGSRVTVIGEVSDACSSGACIGEQAISLFDEVNGVSTI